MKKILKLILIFILFLSIKNIYAANYTIKELIPESIQTTIRGDIFLYKNLKYSNGFIEFDKIENQSSEEHAITINIGLFDKDEKNIGVILYCDEILQSKESVENYSIEVKSKYLAEDKTFKDIKYIAILDENPNCRQEGFRDYIGLKVDEIGKVPNDTVNDDAIRLIQILVVVGIVLLVLFLYRFLFTTAFQNMDGEDVRKDYKNLNKQLAREREEKILKEKPTEPPRKTDKSDEVLKQEKEEQEKKPTDLQDFYK